MKPFPFLLFLMSFLGCKAADFRSVDADRFAQVIEDTTVVRLDVRTASEYSQGHIPGALLIDVTQADFMQKAEQLLPKDKTIALYCRSGRRSKNAAMQLAQQGYQVVELNTGFNSWKGEITISPDDLKYMLDGILNLLLPISQPGVIRIKSQLTCHHFALSLDINGTINELRIPLQENKI